MTDQTQTPQFSTAEFEPVLADSHALFMRGLLFGTGAALLGLTLYATVGIITGYEIGFVSLAVGYIVGKGVVTGSRGRTGRRYQIAAALLTYFAVSMAAIPMGIAYLLKNGDGETTTVAEPAEAGVAPANATASTATSPAETAEEPISAGTVVLSLLFIGLAGPFLQLTELPGGLIGLFILGIGIQLAWTTAGNRAAMVQAAIAGQDPEEKPTTLNLSR